MPIIQEVHVSDETTCQLCKNKLHSYCNICMDKNHNENNYTCTIVTGDCGHVYHSHCIEKYISTGQYSCPIDMIMWNKSKSINWKQKMKKLNLINY